MTNLSNQKNLPSLVLKDRLLKKLLYKRKNISLLLSFIGLFSICLGGCLYSKHVQADTQSFSIDLAQEQVDITTGFTGADIVVYGTRHKKGHVAVVIKGHERKTTVWRKGKFLGIWLNSDSMSFRKVPVYYDFAVSSDLLNISKLDHKVAGEFLSDDKQTENAKNNNTNDLTKTQALKNNDQQNIDNLYDILKEHKIGLNALFFNPDEGGEEEEIIHKFQEALIRTKQAKGFFPLKAKKVNFISDNFFKIKFSLPSNVPAGSYQVQAYLLNSKGVIAQDKQDIYVGQTGRGSEVYDFAQNKSIAYGFLCVVLAVFSGWAANVLVRD